MGSTGAMEAKKSEERNEKEPQMLPNLINNYKIQHPRKSMNLSQIKTEKKKSHKAHHNQTTRKSEVKSCKPLIRPFPEAPRQTADCLFVTMKARR